MEFIEIQRNMVDSLLKIPAMQSFAGRSSLLHGLPPIPLNRSQEIARLDLNNIISELQGIGRLIKEGGVRPVVVIVDNALNYLPEGSETADELRKIKNRLEDYYNGDFQPEPKQPVTGETFEALIFGPQRDTRLSFAFIQQAQITSRSIARLTVSRIFDGVPDGKAVYGTGWIIAPGILITNHHVIDARDRRPKPLGLGEQPAKPADFKSQAEQIVARFDYYVEHIDANYIEYQNATLLATNEQLDYAIIELEQADMITDRIPLSIVSEQPTLASGERINIVQYPQGGPLRYAIRNNFFVRQADKPEFLFYQTDTEPGASGSPAFNDNWQVLALHHAAKQVPHAMVPQEVLAGKPVTVTLLNEAIQLHSILNDLPTNVRQRIKSAQGIG